MDLTRCDIMAGWWAWALIRCFWYPVPAMTRTGGPSANVASTWA